MRTASRSSSIPLLARGMVRLANLCSIYLSLMNSFLATLHTGSDMPCQSSGDGRRHRGCDHRDRRLHVARRSWLRKRQACLHGLVETPVPNISSELNGSRRQTCRSKEPDDDQHMNSHSSPTLPAAQMFPVCPVPNSGSWTRGPPSPCGSQSTRCTLGCPG